MTDEKKNEPRIVDGLPLAPSVTRDARVDVSAPDPAANPRTKPTAYAPTGLSAEPASREEPDVVMVEPPARRRGLVRVAVIVFLAGLAFALAAAITHAVR